MQSAHRLLMGVIVLLAAVTAAPGLRGHDDDQGTGKIVILDNCDPNDPAWTPTGGCQLEEGDVTEEEFRTLLTSPLYDSNPMDPLSGLFLVGHPSWRNQPSHLVVEEFENITVRNRGGRNHTLTPVAAFGGGRVPPLRVGTTMAPECALAAGQTDPWLVVSGGRLELTAPGFDDQNPLNNVHRYQCCLHPWMRATVKVKADDDN
jgi:hypothetical protein